MDDALDLLDASFPGALPVFPGISLAGRYVLTDQPPIHRGDGMKAISLPEARVALLIGDVVGSGAVATTTNARLLTVVRTRLQEGDNAVDAIRHADRYAASAQLAKGATLFVAVISLDDGAVEYAAAGHPPPLLWSRDGLHQVVMEPSRPLGTGGRPASARGRLASGDILALYTDGLLQAGDHRPGGDTHRMIDAFDGASDRPDDLCRILLTDLEGGGRLPDDVALLVAERTTPAAPFVAWGPATAARVRAIADDLERWLDQVGAGLLDHLALRQAFTELAANVVQHAYGHGTTDPGPLSVCAELSDAGVLRLEVGDRGRWLSAPRGRGRGLIVAGGLVDSMRLERRADGTTVILFQELSRTVPVLRANQFSAHPVGSPDPGPSLNMRLEGDRLTLTGRLEERCASDFQDCLHEATRAGTVDALVDLCGVTLLASSAIRVLFEFMERARASDAQVTVQVSAGSVADRVLNLVDLPHQVA